MRRLIFGAVLVALAAAPLAAEAQRDRVVRTIDQTFDSSDFETVVFDLNVGEMKVAGTDNGTIRAEIRVRCQSGRDRDRCEKKAEYVELDIEERHGRLYLEVAGTGLWRSRDILVEAVLTIPKTMPLELEVGTGEVEVENLGSTLSFDMGVGEVTLTNLSGDVTVDMGIGEITLTMPESAVGEVMLDNGIGETELRHKEGRNAVEGILGGTDVHWKSGPGPHTVKIDLNVGEIKVRLR
jgi:hypothetical protein